MLSKKSAVTDFILLIPLFDFQMILMDMFIDGTGLYKVTEINKIVESHSRQECK